MERYEEAALILSLMERLRENGSWCGDTHVQKTAYLLKELCSVPLSFDFILYKHGPFSFDLEDALTLLRARGTIEIEPVLGYGPKLSTTDRATRLIAQHQETIERYSQELDFVAQQFSQKGVAELERLGCALYITLERGGLVPAAERAEYLHELKPHISVSDAEDSVSEIDQLLAQCQRKGWAGE